MQIVWDKEVLKSLSNSHTILELEKITIQDVGIELDAYCVVPGNKIPINELAILDRYKELHAGFISAFKDKNLKLCEDIAEQLTGKFGGELDSFYEIIIERLKNES